jgi:hypothetical protein
VQSAQPTEAEAVAAQEKLIAEFMDGYYGPAAPPMKRLLAYIERRQEEELGTLASVPPAARKYFDPAFFLETDALISEAEKAVADDPKRFANVRQERLALDETMLYLWESLNSVRPLPFQRDALLARRGRPGRSSRQGLPTRFLGPWQRWSS